jgi:tetratricopeptide (TPR) repeat protein
MVRALTPSNLPGKHSSIAGLSLVRAHVDIIAGRKPTELRVAWSTNPGHTSRPIKPPTVARIRALLAAVAEAERDATSPARVIASRAALGELLFEVLDGPERALAQRVAEAGARNEVLSLVIRLRTDEPNALVRHPACGWRFELVKAPAQNALALSQRVRLTVQLGDVDPSREPTVLPEGGLRILVMAFSPAGVDPVLEYEREEEHILTALEGPIQERRVAVRVVEDGSLGELERALRDRDYDIVHLTGHGVLGPDGPRLVMEDVLGRRDDVSPEALLRVLRSAMLPPSLIVLSSCHSAGAADNTPSFAAALVAAGCNAVIGWTRPVRDDLATRASAELYARLSRGATPANAVAAARALLHEADQGAPSPSLTWGTLHFLASDAAAFRLDVKGKPPLDAGVSEAADLYRLLGTRGQMRVLERGFVGRRRPLQRILGILRHGKDGEQAVAGAAIIGMMGMGKSCLAGRALARHKDDRGDLELVVLHGVLDEVGLHDQLDRLAARWDDDRARRIIGNGAALPRRLRDLLEGPWARKNLVFVLDDFEQNLVVRGSDRAVLTPGAAAIVPVLVEACLARRPKLLITTTASFEVVGGPPTSIAEIPIGAFEPSAVRKLWTRGAQKELASIAPSTWNTLAETLGRNPRVLDWARALIGGKTPAQVEALAKDAGEKLTWRAGEAPDEEQQAELVRVFVRHLALEEAREKVSEDALEFVRRARVYESPVPVAALEGLVEGLEIELGRDVVGLQNLGLLEVGEVDGVRAYRVSPLVEPRFEVEDEERWHGVAAEYWEGASRMVGGSFAATMAAWEHALRSRRADIAGRCARWLDAFFHNTGQWPMNRAVAMRNLAAFPESEAGLLWAGSAESASGNPRGGWPLYLRGEALALARGVTGEERSRIMRAGATIAQANGALEEARQRLADVLTGEPKSEATQDVAASLHALGSVLQDMGDLPAAKRSLERSLAIRAKVHGTEDHPGVAASLHALGSVLQAMGDLPAAKRSLERSLAIQAKVHGTEDHPDVAASLHALGSVLQDMGDLPAAKRSLERSLAIQAKVHGTEDHPDVAASLHELGRVLQAMGDLPGAKRSLERSLAIQAKVHGTEDHPDVAASLHALGSVLQDMGDLPAAKRSLERSLAIDAKVHGTEDHPDVAASLHALGSVLQAMGDLPAAKRSLERSLAIDAKVHGTEDHPGVAASLHALGSVLQDMGDLPGAKRSLERSLAIKAKVHGTEDHPDVAASLHALGSVLQDMGDLPAAKRSLERSLAIQAKVHDTEDHPDVAASLHELGRVLQAMGDLPAAKRSLERSLAIKAKVHGTEDHPDVATSLHALGSVLQAMGDLPGAKRSLERSLAIDAKVHGTEDHPGVAASLHALGSVLQAMGDLPGAKRSLERSLAIQAKVHGTEDHPGVAASLHALGSVLHAMGDLLGAKRSLDRSLAIQAKVHGAEDHPDVAASLHALGSVLQGMGDLPGAKRSLERSLAIQAKVHGTEDHPGVAASLHALGSVLHAMGDLPGAKRSLERSLAIDAKVHGTEDHPGVAASLHALGSVLQDMGDLPAAKRSLERSLAIRAKVHGTEDHPGVAASLHALGSVLQAMGDLPAAKRSLERSLAIQAKVHGTEDHPGRRGIPPCVGLCAARHGRPPRREEEPGALPRNPREGAWHRGPPRRRGLPPCVGLCAARHGRPPRREKEPGPLPRHPSEGAWHRGPPRRRGLPPCVGLCAAGHGRPPRREEEAGALPRHQSEGAWHRGPPRRRSLPPCVGRCAARHGRPPRRKEEPRALPRHPSEVAWHRGPPRRRSLPPCVGLCIAGHG